MTNLVCWWLGCKAHPQDGSHCKRCGERLDYESCIGVSGKWFVVSEWLIYAIRRIVPTKCRNCGKRYGDHTGCLPF